MIHASGRVYLEDPVDVLHGGVWSDDGLGVLAHQVVYGRDDFEQLLAGDDSVAVDVVQTERPQQLLVDTAARQHRQTRHELLQRRSGVSANCTACDVTRYD